MSRTCTTRGSDGRAAAHLRIATEPVDGRTPARPPTTCAGVALPLNATLPDLLER